MNQWFKIYFWQLLALILNFAAIFIVTPFLSSQPELFGIYSLVNAMYLFLSYADMGFLSAGIKFSSEAFAVGEKEIETHTIGFTGFILSFFVLLFMIGMGLLYWQPHLMLQQVSQPSHIAVFKQMMLTMIAAAPIFVMQKIIQLIFSIRLQDYINQRVISFFNVIKMGSVYYFFASGKYMIAEYFVFTQICNLAAAIVGLYFVQTRTGITVPDLLRAIRWNPSIFKKMKSLAFGSLFLTICWILYFEIDLIVIGKWMSPFNVAIYALGLNLLTLLRTLYGVFFTPFNVKFNHLYGQGQIDELKNLFEDLVRYTLPFVVLPIAACSISMHEFMPAWVGVAYQSAVPVAQLLLCSFLFSFITYPAGFIVIAFEKTRALFGVNTVVVLVYWIGIGITFSWLGLPAFACFKLVAFCSMAILYMKITGDIFSIHWITFFTKVLASLVLSISSIYGLWYFMQSKSIPDDSAASLGIYMLKLAIITLIGLIVYICSNKTYRQKSVELLQNLKRFF